MYTDWAKPTTKEQRHIEDMFGKMEANASVIVRKIIKSFDKDEASLGLTRTERDLLRKFLFLLKYRGAGFYRRFDHGDLQSYQANDKALLVGYMNRSGFNPPKNVWFHNLKTIMEVDMDTDNKWTHELPKNMFSIDANWFINDVTGYHMTICTPSDGRQEFILTENCYNIFEGPSTFKQDKITGMCVESDYAPLHQFAPLSPKLMIVLRANVLPCPEEDANLEVKQ
ncbi:hypothetical protein S40293_04094 [Stachybotrys chartarum IBT 40293]|nr:hypothetical protein S40293_04094 [Stachybotrys chartarum IBT 40293]